MSESLRITEIFLSIQGESSFAGWPCVFVRTTRCPLRCSWCDTTYSYGGGNDMTLDEIIDEVLGHGVEHVEITGGEPLAQKPSLELMTRLCDEGKTVLLETSGSLDIGPVDPRVHVIMDIKCPQSGMSDRMRWENIDLLKGKDEVKFVLGSREDYEYARDVIRRHDLTSRRMVLLSTVFGAIDRNDIVAWMLEDRIHARFQLQMQKFIWSPDQRGV